MRIKTTDFASGRTRDGRQFTAGAGATLEVDDADRDMVDLFRSFVDQGVAELVDDEPAGDGEANGDGEQQDTQETEPEQASQPAEPKKATVAAAKKAGRTQ